MRAYTTLRVERDGPVGLLVFDRPDRGNAMNAAMLAELENAWAELDADPAVRVIVNTGAGAAFQTGLDLGQLARDPAALREQSRRTARDELRLTARHNDVGKPVIAAVNGVCAGGGLHFIADADLVIASTEAAFLDPHVTVGQVSASEAIGLARRIAFERVMRMVLTGRHERLGAREAYDLGLVGSLHEPADLAAAARDLAERIARNPPAALAAVKRALWNALETGLTEARRAAARDLAAGPAPAGGPPGRGDGPAAGAAPALAPAPAPAAAPAPALAPAPAPDPAGGTQALTTPETPS